MTLWEYYGSDEHRAAEAIAALLDLNPFDFDEDAESLAQRMAAWGTLQGPNVRWEAMWYVTHAMIEAQAEGVKFPLLAEVGMDALHEYNWLVWGDE